MDRIKKHPLTFKCRHRYRYGMCPATTDKPPEDPDSPFADMPTRYDSVGFWMFDCPYCSTVHTHSPGDGHRLSHCEVENDENKDGYYLVLEE